MYICICIHVNISDYVSCHVCNFVAKEYYLLYNSYQKVIDNVLKLLYWHRFIKKNLYFAYPVNNFNV